MLLSDTGSGDPSHVLGSCCFQSTLPRSSFPCSSCILLDQCLRRVLVSCGDGEGWPRSYRSFPTGGTHESVCWSPGHFLGLTFAAGAYFGPWLNGGVSRITKDRVLRPSADAGLSPSANESGDYSATAEHAPLVPSSVHALGRLEPAGGLDSVGAPPGARVERMLVEPGQQVQAGQELAYIGGHAEAEASVRLIQAQLSETRLQGEAESEFEQILDQEAKIERNELVVLEDPLRKTKQSNIKLLQDKTENSRINYGRLGSEQGSQGHDSHPRARGASS